jgi:hypothetical protein
MEELREEFESYIQATIQSLEQTDIALKMKILEISNTLSKFTLLSIFMVGVMMVHLIFFGSWVFFRVGETKEMQMQLQQMMQTSKTEHEEVAQRFIKIDENQKAILDASVETNYTVRGHDDEQQAFSTEVLTSMKSLIQENKSILIKLRDDVAEIQSLHKKQQSIAQKKKLRL